MVIDFFTFLAKSLISYGLAPLESDKFFKVEAVVAKFIFFILTYSIFIIDLLVCIIYLIFLYFLMFLFSISFLLKFISCFYF